MITDGRPSAFLAIEGCFNFRDAGGWPTGDGRRMRTGLLYRSDDPIRLTVAGRRAVDDLGLRAVVDLRQASQVERSPGFAEPSVTYLLPLVDRVIDIDAPPRLEEAADLAELYEQMLERGAESLVAAVEAVAVGVAEGPVLIHCAVGKDRTGMLVALIQAALGVGLEAIAAEYTRSDGPSRARRQAMIAAPLPDDPPVARSPELLWTAPGEAMVGFAGRAAERHGSLAAWPLAIGVRPETVAALRAALLEPAVI